jgi:predicted pyridoxine 5'-phosphate oxidase superfamily flavin-nucleotide-binding protein
MVYDVENVVENIDFSMKMEDMPLTNEDKNRLRNCLNGTVDVDKILQEIIKKHTYMEP